MRKKQREEAGKLLEKYCWCYTNAANPEDKMKYHVAVILIAAALEGARLPW